jgi:hypothetical protein
MDPDPTPDPAPFFIDFKDAKYYFLFIFFLITCPQAHRLKICFFAKIFSQKVILQALFQTL